MILCYVIESTLALLDINVPTNNVKTLSIQSGIEEVRRTTKSALMLVDFAVLRRIMGCVRLDLH